MKVKFCPFLFLVFYSGLSNAQVSLTGKAHAELQTKNVSQTSAQKEVDSSWEGTEGFHTFYSNFDGELKVNKSSVDINWFFRHSQSDLNKTESPTLSYVNFPSKVIARDIFKLEKIDRKDQYATDSIINKFIFDWSYDGTEFIFGRMFINYGQGTFYNPINPFNIPLPFTSFYNINQGNDGLMFSMSDDQTHVMTFYFLGDQQINDYNGQISRTIWLKGDLKKSEKYHFLYTFGEDQKRHHLGGEFKWNLSHAKFFAQYLSQSKRLDNKENSERLHHSSIGYQRYLKPHWSLTLEVGRQDMDELLPSSYPRSYLPMEHYSAAMTNYEWTDKLSTGISHAIDPKTVFNLTKFDITYQFQKNLSTQVFALNAARQDHENPKYQFQRFVSDEVGLRLIAQF
jgi:hypothetical protein